MKRLIILTILLLSTVLNAGENPFEIRFTVKGEFIEVKRALTQVLRQEGIEPVTITIRKYSPRLEVLYFCKDRPPRELPELYLLYPCRIYILEGEGNSQVGLINAGAITSAFRKRLSSKTLEGIKKMAEKVRSAIEEVKKRWEMQ